MVGLPSAPPSTTARPIVVVAANQSFNWSGYVQGSLEPGKGPFHSIVAIWSVPTATPHRPGEAEYSSSWIGIGGGCLDTSCKLTDATLMLRGRLAWAHDFNTDRNVQAAFVGNAADGLMSGQESIRAQVALRRTGLMGVPLVNVENGCATASTALHLGWQAVAGGMHDWVLSAERMAKVLADKGYHYQFVFARNSKHVDRPTVAQTLPSALEWLWKGYPAP